MEVSHQDESTEPEHRSVHLVRNDPAALNENRRSPTPEPQSESGPDLASESIRVVTPVEHDGPKGARKRMDGQPGEGIGRYLSSVAGQPDRRHAAAQVVVITSKRRILDFHVLRQRRSEDRKLPLKPDRTPAQPSKIKQQATFLPPTLALQSNRTSVHPDCTDGVQPHVGSGNLRTDGL